jgi:hypothetical protein
VNIAYSESARQWGEGYTLLQQATMRLEEIGGPSAGQVKAEWDRAEDSRGRTIYTLRLSDWTGAVSAAFAPEELRNSTHMRYRLLRLWGDLLQVRSDKLLQDLTGNGSQAGE